MVEPVGVAVGAKEWARRPRSAEHATQLPALAQVEIGLPAGTSSAVFSLGDGAAIGWLDALSCTRQAGIDRLARVEASHAVDADQLAAPGVGEAASLDDEVSADSRNATMNPTRLHITVPA